MYRRALFPVPPRPGARSFPQNPDTRRRGRPDSSIRQVRPADKMMPTAAEAALGKILIINTARARGFSSVRGSSAYGTGAKGSWARVERRSGRPLWPCPRPHAGAARNASCDRPDHPTNPRQPWDPGASAANRSEISVAFPAIGGGASSRRTARSGLGSGAGLSPAKTRTGCRSCATSLK